MPAKRKPRNKAMTEPGLQSWKHAGHDQWWSDGGSRGAGRLYAKLSMSQAQGQTRATKQVSFYFSYYDSGKVRRFYPIGDYGSMKLAEARTKAAALSALYRAGTVDIHAHFASEQRAKLDANKAAERSVHDAEARSRSHTLKELLDAYTGHLERQGRQSASDVVSIFRVHVLGARQDLAATRAAEIPASEFVEIIRSLKDEGKVRTAAKLRSYLRAAYGLAMDAESNPNAPATMLNFGLVSNPIASIRSVAPTNARQRHLSAPELHHFLTRLAKLPQSPKTDAFALCLLLGGQRPAQLLRVGPQDVDLSAEVITIYDGKGKRQQPRPHALPLTAPTKSIIERALALRGESPALFTSDGRTTLRPETLSGLVAELSAAMLKAKETREGFELRDIRRTCETMLASLGISKDVRAQLQSHGLGGVQDRHYDRHSYMLEKRDALTKWQNHLERITAGKTATVQPLHKVSATN